MPNHCSPVEAREVASRGACGSDPRATAFGQCATTDGDAECERYDDREEKSQQEDHDSGADHVAHGTALAAQTHAASIRQIGALLGSVSCQPESASTASIAQIALATSTGLVSR